MSESNLQHQANEKNSDLELQKFEQLNLKEIGLSNDDFNEVVNAHKDLANINFSNILNDFYKKFFCVEKKIVDLRTYLTKK